MMEAQGDAGPGPSLADVQCVRFVSAAQLTVFFTRCSVPHPFRHWCLVLDNSVLWWGIGGAVLLMVG